MIDGTVIKLSFGNSYFNDVAKYLVDSNAIIYWDEYVYDSDFLTPCDAFTFRVSGDNISPVLRQLFTTPQVDYTQSISIYSSSSSSGTPATTNFNTINQQTSTTSTSTQTTTNAAQASVKFIGVGLPITLSTQIPGQQTLAMMAGFVEQIDIENSREGTFFTLRGRNILGPLCDSGIDPWSSTYKFTDGMTLLDVIGKCFSNFGITQYWLTDSVNRELATGIDKSKATLTESFINITIPATTNFEEGLIEKASTITQKVTQWIDPTNTYDLTEKSVQKLQPKHNQTFMEFIEENLKRFHLTTWSMVDGSGVVIGAPDYSDGANLGQQLINRFNGNGNNIKKGRLVLDFFNQPSMIVAKGYQGGGDFANTRIKCIKINEFLGLDTQGQVLAGVQTVINQFRNVKIINNSDLLRKYNVYFNPPSIPRVIYWEDEKSRTQDQLESAVIRKMSEYQMHAFNLHYVVADHQYNNIPWRVNTIVNVNDEELGIINTLFWVRSVTYKKSRNAGTTSELILIPVNVLQL